MPIYFYRAINKKNKEVKGKLEKESKQKTIEFLKSSELLPIEVKKINMLTKNIEDTKLFKKDFTKKELGWFCRQLSFMLLAGIPVSQCLEIISEQSNKKKFKNAVASLNDDILKGDSLNKSLSKSFPSLLSNMVRVGEATGSLANIFTKMATYYEEKNRYEQELKSAMIYPMVVSIMMLLVIIIALIFVIPNYSVIFLESGIELPLPTKILINSSNFLATNIYYIILFLIASTIYLMFLLQTRNGKKYKDYFLLNCPIVKIVTIKVLNHTFSNVLHIMLESGISLIESLKTVNKVINNKIIDKDIKKMISEIEQGKSLSVGIRSCKYFNIMLHSMVRIGEETGFVSKTLETCSNYFKFEIDQLILNLNKLIEPVITIVLGLILGFIMLAIMLPTFALTNIL